MPQYHFTGFPSPTARQPIPFQKQENAYLYDSQENQQIRPQPFKPSKQIVPSTFKPPHSHYLNSHHNDPSQTETFLGQITLQSPELPEVPPFRPRDFPFQQPHSLVDQFDQDSKWKNQPKVNKPTRGRTNNKTFKDLTDAVDQSLDTYEDKDSSVPQSSETFQRKPQITHLDRPLQTNSVNASPGRLYNSRPRVVNNPENSIKSKEHVNSYVINNGETYTTGRNGFRPKPTSTTQLPTTKERTNRFRPSTKSPGKPVSYHVRTNKQQFVPRHPVGSSTTENNSNFDFESLLEDPIHQSDEPYDHKDDVEVIQSAISTEPEEQSTIEDERPLSEDGQTTHSSEIEYHDDRRTTHSDTEDIRSTEPEYTTHSEEYLTESEEREHHMNDYSGETTSGEYITYEQLKQEPSTTTTSPQTTPTTPAQELNNTATTENIHKIEEHEEEATTELVYEYEYTDEEEDKHNSTVVPETNEANSKENETVSDKERSKETLEEQSEEHSNRNVDHSKEELRVPSTEEHEVNTETDASVSDKIEEQIHHDYSDTAEDSYQERTEKVDTTTQESSFDVLTMKPSPMTVEDDNFNGFVDSTLIDNTTEEQSNFTEKSEPVTSPVVEESTHKQPLLIGEAVVSVVTTKSVVNGTYSTPSTTELAVTPQITTPTTYENTSDGWIVVASVQTSRSVSGARYLNFPLQEKDKQHETEQEDKSKETNADSETTEDPNHEEIITTIENTNKSIASSTESIIDKLDRVQSELSNGFLSGDFKNGNNIAIISEMPSETTPTTSTTLPPVVIRKFSPNNRPTTTRAPKRPRINFDTIKQDELAPGLLPAGFKPKYQNYKTSTTVAPLDLDLPQGDQPIEIPEKNHNTREEELKKKIVFTDDVSALLPPGYKPPKEKENVSTDPVKTLEGFLTKIRNESAKNNNKPKSTDKLFENAKPIDVSAFLPPGYKSSKPEPTTTTTVKPKSSIDSIINKATPVDISSLLPPGYKPPKEEKTNNTSSLLAKAVPVDISSFLPPGYKPAKETSTTEKPKGFKKLLDEAEPVDVSKFLPPGYTGFKGRFTTKKPETTETTSTTTSPVVTPSITPSSTTASSGGFKVVFPSRPGGNKKAIHRLTTPKSTENGAPVQTAPSIHKGWPSR